MKAYLVPAGMVLTFPVTHMVYRHVAEATPEDKLQRVGGMPSVIRKSAAGRGIRVISFFAGAGGLDLGFEQAGYEIAYANDNEEVCCKTLRANSGGWLSSNLLVECEDIRKVDSSRLPRNVDLVIGGPPCQTFSASGRRAGGAPGRLDPRGTLFEAYCRIIDAVKPRAFLFENVRGILATNEGADWRAIVNSFQRIGYRISYRILDALDYGAPQQRERMFMVGTRGEGTPFLFPRPIYGPDSLRKLPYRTAGGALLGLDGDTEDRNALRLDNGKYAHLLPLVPPGENYLFFTAKRGNPNPIFAYRSRFSDFLYKANPETPIKTLIARPGKYTGPFHWENRCFTVREYLRLQGFPDDYKISGSRDEAVQQIGNSVSPKVAHQLAVAIANQVFGRSVPVSLMATDATLSFDKRKGEKAKATRARHEQAQAKHEKAQAVVGRRPADAFKLSAYQASIKPSEAKREPNCSAVVRNRTVTIVVHADSSKAIFARMSLLVASHPTDLASDNARRLVQLNVVVYGRSDHSIQTMWNAVDDWVIRSSRFHSLFELYGHFTEPHPVFRITQLKTFSRLPIAGFAVHAASFENCSQYFPRQHLTSLFGRRFGAKSFLDLVGLLRSYRFDIRCRETNIAIPPSLYMVAYPFTLPFGKQMNFSVRQATQGAVAI